jgi:hypothetical protein
MFCLELVITEGNKLTANNSANDKNQGKSTGKKPYTTPSLRFESVFEVSALACGKVFTSQGDCKFSTKAS